MESNEQTELTSKIETDSQIESRMTTIGWGGQGLEGWSKKEKGLMDMDNGVMTVGQKRVKQVKW